jgi:hypothetical protein
MEQISVSGKIVADVFRHHGNARIVTCPTRSGRVQPDAFFTGTASIGSLVD